MPTPDRRRTKHLSGPGLLIGYARVSTEEQNLALQLEALKKAGCARVFTDKASGTGAVRPGLAEALSHLRPGDTLVARKLGRVGGRKRRMTDSKIKAARRLLAGGTPPRDVADNLGVSVPTLYRWLPASERA